MDEKLGGHPCKRGKEAGMNLLKSPLKGTIYIRNPKIFFSYSSNFCLSRVPSWHKNRIKTATNASAGKCEFACEFSSVFRKDWGTNKSNIT